MRTTLIRQSMVTETDESAADIDAQDSSPQIQEKDTFQTSVETATEDEPEQAPAPDPLPEPPVDAVEATVHPDEKAVRQQAYEQGMADLAARYEEEIQQAVSAFTEGCHRLSRQRTALLEQHRTQYINLIILLCEKIVRQELKTPRNIIAATLQSALEEAIACEEYHVTLHPEDLRVAEQKAPEMVAALRGIDRVVFKTDESVTRGGCLLESQICTVDATVETQLAGLKEFVVEQNLVPPLEFDGDMSTPRSPAGQPD